MIGEWRHARGANTCVTINGAIYHLTELCVDGAAMGSPLSGPSYSKCLYGSIWGGSSWESHQQTITMEQICGRHICDMATWTNRTPVLPQPLEQPQGLHQVHHGGGGEWIHTIPWCAGDQKQQPYDYISTQEETHTDRYLHYGSYDHPRAKTGTISCLRRRAETLCSEKNVDKEMKHPHDLFTANEYPESITNRCLLKKAKPHMKKFGDICLEFTLVHTLLSLQWKKKADFYHFFQL